MVNIYGTLGPGCADAGILEEMFRNGMTGVRLNLSHSTLPTSKVWLDELKRAADDLGIKPQLLIDMQGPEIRIGDVGPSRMLDDGDEVYLSVPEGFKDDSAAGETVDQVNIPVPEMVMPYLSPGQQALLDDGKLLLEVTEREMDTAGRERAKARVIRGGKLLGEKSIALPGVELHPPTMTDTDRKHISMAKEYSVTGIMQPFVRDREDLRIIRDALNEAGAGDIRLFVKIENMEGIHHLKDLLPGADEIIIARGDLGNSMPLWQLPAAQKYIASECLKAGKPFLVVTQMLASMETVAVPTRAEVSDVFNAVLDGASSLMVTGETAVGRYPAEVIKYLVNTAQSALEYKKSTSK